MRYLLLVFFEIALTTYCIVDALRHPDEKPYGLPRLLWVLMFLFFPIVSELVWLYLKWRSWGGPKQRPSGPLAPDDDPEYLRWLAEQERRRRQR